MEKNERDRILQYLQEKLKLCNELLDISKKQRIWIEREEFERLSNTIGSREKKIGRIKYLDKILEERYSNAEGDREIEEFKRKINEAAEEICRAEESNMLLLRETSDAYKKKFIETQTRIKLNAAYGFAKEVKSGRFINKIK